MTRNTPKKKPRPKPKPQQVSNEVLLAQIAVQHTKIRGVVMFFAMVGLALMILACWPVASVLAGKDTELNVSIALGLTLTATLAGGGIARWGWQHKKRADKLEKRNDQLSRDVKELKERCRENQISDKVSR